MSSRFLSLTRSRLIHRGHLPYTEVDEDARDDCYRKTPKYTRSATIRQAEKELADHHDGFSKSSFSCHRKVDNIREEKLPCTHQDSGKAKHR